MHVYSACRGLDANVYSACRGLDANVYSACRGLDDNVYSACRGLDANVYSAFRGLDASVEIQETQDRGRFAVAKYKISPGKQCIRCGGAVVIPPLSVQGPGAQTLCAYERQIFLNWHFIYI